MAKGKRMCPNEGCEKFQQQTGMMGGCECGTALVEYYIAPSDEQLENFARVVLAGEAARRGIEGASVEFAVMLAMRDPRAKENLLKRHRELQRSANNFAPASAGKRP